MTIPERSQRETAREYALRVIKERIISLQLTPGSVVSENEIASSLGISRTPVRESLIELSQTQIVEIIPQLGSRVSLIDYNLVDEARFIRLVIETAIVELACHMAKEEDIIALENNVKLQEFYLQTVALDKLLDIDDSFHYELFRISNKLQTYNMAKNMAIHFDRVRSLSIYSVDELKIVADHREIAAAIRARDPELAKQVMTKHLSRYKLDEDGMRKKHPEYFK